MTVNAQCPLFKIMARDSALGRQMLSIGEREGGQWQSAGISRACWQGPGPSTTCFLSTEEEHMKRTSVIDS